MNTSAYSWKNWLKPNRIVPSITLLGAGLANVLSFLDVIQLSVFESIIIAILALLSIDALIERISILERIETKLASLSNEQILRTRADLPKPAEQTENASEVCILGVGSHFIISQHLGLWERKLMSGCKMRIILLNPESQALATWNLLASSSIPKRRIGSTLEILKELRQKPEVKDNCEVRLSNILFPFSMFGADFHKNTGTMIVEYYAYNVQLDERPHMHLTPIGSPYWFNYYRRQFEEAWLAASPWDDNDSSTKNARGGYQTTY